MKSDEPIAKYSHEHLVAVMSKLVEPQKELELSDLRYVLYARKSTKGDEKQYRSINDQISECYDYAEKYNLRIKDVVRETESAKDSNKRPKFSNMISDIENGKYDGIIAWHPDRISRNMREAGMVIDMLDQGSIKDLKFPSFSFTNDKDGKVLLGIAFVMAKQYSEGLSGNVLRAVDRIVSEGGNPAKETKFGYYKERGQMFPDGTNFDIIQHAWKMRVQGETLDDIAKYISDKGLTKTVGSGTTKRRTPKVLKNTLSKMFQDSAYAGVLVYATRVINLIDAYGFKPMVTVEEFFKVNPKLEASQKDLIRKAREGAVIGDYLRGMVLCDSCGKFLRPAPTVKDLKTEKQIIVYLRCMTDGCKMQNKSARAQVVDLWMQDFLTKSEWLCSKDAYNTYVTNMTKYIAEKNANLKNDKNTLTRKLSNQQTRLSNLKDAYIETRSKTMKKDLENDTRQIRVEIAQTKNDLEKVVEKIKHNKESILAYGEFYELFKNLPLLWQKVKKMKHKDKLARILFTNLTVSLEENTGKKAKVVHFTLNSPFKELYKRENVSLGGPGRT